LTFFRASLHPPRLPPAPTRRSSDLMLVIFGFIAGLKPHPDTDLRSGIVSRVLHLFVDRPLTDEQYALWGGVIVVAVIVVKNAQRSEEHTSELQSRENLVRRLLLVKK